MVGGAHGVMRARPLPYLVPVEKDFVAGLAGD